MNDLYTPKLDSPVKVSSVNTQRVAVSVLILLLIAAAVRIVLNVNDARALQEYTAKTLERNVLVTSAKAGELQRTLALPTTLRGNTEAVIYARTSGYLAAWYKGIGDQVKKGDLLATIDAPEQTQELIQSRAQREQIAARADFAEQTLARWEQLQQRQSAISQQDLAEKRSAVRQAKADLDAANANVKRLEQLESFRRIVAPFSGILTRRSIEVGDLIASGGKELFAITQTDPLRLTIWVSQAYADDLKIGAPVTVSLREQAGAKLKASIERIAGGIDPDTRARQVDLILPNPGAKILPGVYAEVNIQLTSGIKALVVPAAVLIITDQTPRVAVVEKDNRIAYRTVKLGRDLGRDVEILDGLNADDVLVVSPSDQLVEGELVATKNWQPTNAVAANTVAVNTVAGKTVAANTPKKENADDKKEGNKLKEK